jgi:cleavage and polyadenylation specificity factor subunit 1
MNNFQGMQIIFDMQNSNMRPYIPKELQRRFFNQIHNLSHPGAKTIIKTISQRGVWKNYKKDCVEWTKTCINCQKSKINKHTKTPVINLSLPTSKFKNLHLDLIGPLVESEGMKYCLTIIDRFTRWVEVIPLADIQCSTIIRAFWDNWIARYGVPEQVTTDRGRQFVSNNFKNYCCRIGIKHVLTTSYHPQHNGIIERFHRTLKTCFKAHHPTPWTKSLSTILLGLRSVVRDNTDYSVSEMLYGTTLRLPSDIFMENSNQLDPNNYAQELINFMQNIKPKPVLHHTRDNIFVHPELSTATHMFIRDDRVYKPLLPAYCGPYKVCFRSDKTATLEINGQKKVVSLDRCKPAFLEAGQNNTQGPDYIATTNCNRYVTRSGRQVIPRDQMN